MKQVQKFEKQQAKTPILPVISTRKKWKNAGIKEKEMWAKSQAFLTI